MHLIGQVSRDEATIHAYVSDASNLRRPTAGDDFGKDHLAVVEPNAHVLCCGAPLACIDAGSFDHATQIFDRPLRHVHCERDDAREHKCSDHSGDDVSNALAIRFHH